MDTLPAASERSRAPRRVEAVQPRVLVGRCSWCWRRLSAYAFARDEFRGMRAGIK
jgi:hypothetical protein